MKPKQAQPSSPSSLGTTGQELGRRGKSTDSTENCLLSGVRRRASVTPAALGWGFSRAGWAMVGLDRGGCDKTYDRLNRLISDLQGNPRGAGSRFQAKRSTRQGGTPNIAKLPPPDRRPPAVQHPVRVRHRRGAAAVGSGRRVSKVRPESEHDRQRLCDTRSAVAKTGSSWRFHTFHT